MTALLPEGRVVFNPESAKLVKVVPGNSQYVVIVKLDDDTEILIKTYSSAEEAYSMADRCSNVLNGEDDLSEDEEIFEEGGEGSSASFEPGSSAASSGGASAASGRGSGSSSGSSSGGAGIRVSASGGGSAAQTAADETAGADSEPEESEDSWGAPETVADQSSEAQGEEESEEPVPFPESGSALENSLEDSDEWPCDNGLDDWND